MDASTTAAAQTQPARPPSVWALLVRYKLASLIVLVVVLAFVAIVVPEVLSAGKLKVSDSTSCSAWSSARPNQQAAYARLYLRLHRSLPSGGTSPANIEAAVNYGCIEAYSFDEADAVTVLQAIRRQY